MLLPASFQDPSRPRKGQVPFPILQRDRTRALDIEGSWVPPSLWRELFGAQVPGEGSAFRVGWQHAALQRARFHRLPCGGVRLLAKCSEGVSPHCIAGIFCTVAQEVWFLRLCTEGPEAGDRKGLFHPLPFSAG